MCGIIAYIGKSPTVAKQKIINQYQEQHHRGKEGFGLIAINNKGITIERATEPFKMMFDLQKSTTPALFFHHRLPTSTPNKMRQTHPITVNHDELTKTWHIMHNGCIGNADELFTKHTEKLGYLYTTLRQNIIPKVGYKTLNEDFNDSEAIAIELARFFEGKDTLIDTHSSCAFVAVSIDKKTKKMVAYWGRNNGNPLSYDTDDDGIIIASDLSEETNSTEIEAFKAHSCDISAYFASKTEKKHPVDFMKDHDLVFKKLPLLPAVSHSTTNLERKDTYWKPHKNNKVKETHSVSKIEEQKIDALEKLYDKEQIEIMHIIDDFHFDILNDEFNAYLMHVTIEDIKEILNNWGNSQEKIQTNFLKKEKETVTKHDHYKNYDHLPF